MNKLLDYTAALIMFSVQSFCAYAFYTGSRGLHGNIHLDLGGIIFFIYAVTVLHFKESVKFLIVNILWTTGFYILFQENWTSISGALLIAVASWQRYLLRKDKC